jgi:methylase of polypeptide subunit release factors
MCHRQFDAASAVTARQYLAVGLSAVRCVDNTLKISRTKAVRTILDLPCGHGRVLRFLKVAFPEARVVACDIDATAVSFCKRTFSVEAILSTKRSRSRSQRNLT